MNSYDARYGINVSIINYKTFEANRMKLGITADEYLCNLMMLDYSGEVVLEKPTVKYKRYVDLKQSRLYSNDALKPGPPAQE